MASSSDDDDWVGEPPEGRHSRDRADPAHWRRRPPPSVLAAGLGIVLVVLALALLL